MHWFAPSEEELATDTLEERHWHGVDQVGATSGHALLNAFIPLE